MAQEGPWGLNPQEWEVPPKRRPGQTASAILRYNLYGVDDRSLLDWRREQFKKLGIDLIIRATDYNRFQEKVRKGRVQIFSWGWNADYPDPENFLFLLYGGNGVVESVGWCKQCKL